MAHPQTLPYTQEQLLASLTARFIELSERYSHMRRGSQPPGFRLEYLAAQVEMFRLAQAIGSHVCPAVQFTLNQARRYAMEEITTEMGSIPAPFVMTPSLQTRPFRWSDVQISPEVSSDPHITGRFVSRVTTKMLRDAHRAQISNILQHVNQIRRAWVASQ